MVVEASLSAEEDRLPVERIALLVQVLHEGVDAALVTEVVTLVVARIADHDPHARV